MTQVQLFLPMHPEPTLPNGWQVGPTLWRSAQPTDWTVVQALGIRRVIDLRPDGEDHSWAEEHMAVTAIGAQPLNWPTSGFIPPAGSWFADIQNALRGDFPTLIHCEHGCDRTGAAIAAYQLVHSGNPRLVHDAFWAAQPHQEPWGEFWMLSDAVRWWRKHHA